MAITDTDETANLLWPHLPPGQWREVAAITHPGIGRRIAAIEAGDATTATIPADVAVRLLSELEPAAAAAAAKGDTRSTVRAAIGAPATQRAPGRLLTGTPADVAARLEGRTRVTSDEVAAEYLTVDTAVRDAAAPHLLAVASAPIAGVVLVELASRGRAEITVLQMIAAYATGTFRPRGKANRWKLTAALRDAATIAVAASGFTPALTRDTPVERPAVPTPTLDEAGAINLVACAVFAGVAVQCDPRTAVAAVSGPGSRSTAGRDQNRVAAAFVTAGISGARWADVDHLAELLEGRHIGVALTIAIGAGAPAQYIADAAATLFPVRRASSCLQRSDAARILEHCGAVIDPVVATNMCLTASPRNPALVVNWLAGNHGETPTVAATRNVAEDPYTRGHLTELGAGGYTLTGITSAASLAPQLRPLWGALVETRPCDEVIAAAANSAALTGLAAVFAETVGDLIDATGAPEGTWAAVCALAGRFSGTVAELVDVAAGTAPTTA